MNKKNSNVLAIIIFKLKVLLFIKSTKKVGVLD